MAEKKEKKVISELQFYKGVGPARAEAFQSAGINQALDLIFYLPRTYVSHHRVPTLAALSIKMKREILFANEQNNDAPGNDEMAFREEITILARVIKHKEHTINHRKKLLSLEVADGTGERAYINFWTYTDYYKKSYPLSVMLSITGTPEFDKFYKITFNHPEIEILDENDEAEFKMGTILPIYPLTEKMKRMKINTKIIRKIVYTVLQSELINIRENLPEYLIKKQNLFDLHSALMNIHFPESLEKLDKAKFRLKFNEIFYFELMLASKTKNIKSFINSILINPKSERARKLYESLPFELTVAQKRVINEIMEDMKSGRQMNRLLQGDVGSGKTIVAILTMLAAVDNGYQVAIMAPTELLAEQHYLTMSKLTHNLDIKIVQLVGGQKTKWRKELLELIKTGEANMICGTHAMFESNIEYNRLGYIVIDEQHRFGVNQRADLIFQGKKSLHDDKIPHILVMSATPIPRTLSMTLYGDLDVSVINEIPKNRLKTITKIVYESEIESVYEFIRKRVASGEQAFIVYPLVDKSDKIELKSAIEHFDKFRDSVFRNIPIGLLHGQMSGSEKDEIMQEFLNNKYKIIVATTVIEVGIDVPNATIMVIENAERFGLSQLHQLRGRVGRGPLQSYCILVTKDRYKYSLKANEIPNNEKRAAIIRLKKMEKTNDGFEIAELDLKLRGPGDLLGTRQSGLPDFKFIDIVNDLEIIAKARKLAFEIIASDANLQKKENLLLKFNLNYYQDKNIYFDIP